MPRPPRLELPGVPLHVVQRGNNRAACFFGDADRRFYLKCLARAALRHGCAVHAYVLMSNHVHLLVTPAKRGSVGTMLQELGRRYVRIINALHGRTGTLWEGRFKSSLIDSETYLLTCHRYIELNPVRAGLVAHPAAYRWSSHEYYAAGKTDSLITEHVGFSGLGRDREQRQAAFRELFEIEIDPETLTRIRDSVNAGSALGSPAFLEHVKGRVGRPVDVPKRGRPAKPLPEDDGAVMPVSGKLF
jgi:putative transposase